MSPSDFFHVPKPYRCAAVSQSPDEVCHRHPTMERSNILFWSAVSTLIGFIVGILISWFNDIGYDSLNFVMLMPAINQLNKIPVFIGWGWMIVIFVLSVFLWSLATLLVCTRKFTSIGQYVLLGIATPASLLSAVSPIVS